MEMKLIGHVGVDSGQLLLCDPGYIDSQWEKEDFEDIRIYEHTDTKERLQYRVDFGNYGEVIPKYGKTMNELLEDLKWEQLENPVEPKHNFSYNSCAQATLSEEGHGQLKYKMGHDGVGVAFSTAYGDGFYPVYAIYDRNGILQKVEVVFTEEDEEIFDGEE